MDRLKGVSMGVDYGYEKFYKVLNYAVGSADPVQRRLEVVLSGIGHLLRDSFPDDGTWKRFETLLNRCTSQVALENEGAIAATTSQMSNEEAIKWLREVFSILMGISEAYSRTKQ